MDSIGSPYWVGYFIRTRAVILVDRTVINTSQDTFFAYSLNYDCMREFLRGYREVIEAETDRRKRQAAITRYEEWKARPEGIEFHRENNNRRLVSDREHRDRQGIELQNRTAQIQYVCAELDIPTLIHFTRVQNLCSILEIGLLGRSALEAQSLAQQPQYNDLQRIDGYMEAVCVSVSFPNYQMFYKYNHSSPAEWVVLLLDKDVLWELDCAFCQENASSGAIRNIPLEHLKRPDALEGMFVDYHHIRRQDLQIPNNYPTHPQAEVLVFESISVHYINAVHFLNSVALRRWLSNNQVTYSPSFFSNRRYFSPRSDWEIWRVDNSNVRVDCNQSSSISNGEIPF